MTTTKEMINVATSCSADSVVKTKYVSNAAIKEIE
jgi:hypothetical protein